jgi:hypothetical protein
MSDEIVSEIERSEVEKIAGIERNPITQRVRVPSS